MPAFRDLGDYIRDQRTTAQISLRQLAAAAGVSNPYLSQIERGLRKPSAEILQQIAKGLRISAEAMYVQAGILDEHEGSPTVISAVNADELLSDRQKQMLLEIYQSFVRSEAADQAAGSVAAHAASDLGAEEAAARPGTVSVDEPLWPEDAESEPIFPPPTATPEAAPAARPRKRAAAKTAKPAGTATTKPAKRATKSTTKRATKSATRSAPRRSTTD